MKKIALFLNLEKSNSSELADEVISYLEKKRVGVFIYSGIDDDANLCKLKLDKEDVLEEVDCILVLGGDGTILKAARTLADKDIPILGINLGYLGFLAELEPKNLKVGLDKLIEKEYRTVKRMMLNASVIRNNVEIGNFTALNDIVVTKGGFARMVEYDIYVEDQYASTYIADGLIVSSPTGSTAYSLSAGGPIVSPELELLIFTPICPHTLYARPIIISSEKSLKVVICSKQSDVMITMDGQCGLELQLADVISVTKSQYNTKLIRFDDKSFYSILREKLKGGKR